MLICLATCPHVPQFRRYPYRGRVGIDRKPWLFSEYDHDDVRLGSGIPAGSCWNHGTRHLPTLCIIHLARILLPVRERRARRRRENPWAANANWCMQNAEVMDVTLSDWARGEFFLVTRANQISTHNCSRGPADARFTHVPCHLYVCCSLFAKWYTILSFRCGGGRWVTEDMNAESGARGEDVEELEERR